MAFCTHCGGGLKEGAKFCGACGQRAEELESVPVFTPPVVQVVTAPSAPVVPRAPIVPSKPTTTTAPIPEFQPPAQVEAPVFTPPATDAIPVFTPPTADTIPVFTPPQTPVHSGPCCYFHAGEAVTAHCTRCGKALCHDCADTYRVTLGQYADKVLCYDCTREIVAENVEVLKENKNKITTTFVVTLVGMLVGAIVGAGGGGMGLFLGAVIGGCFWTFLKNLISRIGGAMQGGGVNIASFLIGLFVGFFIEAVASIYRTGRKVIECIIYLSRTSNFIEEDTRALQEMADYMEYTLVRNKNRGVDLETLIGQSGQLNSNSYAQSVLAHGEAQAEAQLRRGVTTIAENGEIIRSFAA